MDTATPTATPDCPDAYEVDDDRMTQAKLLVTDGQPQLHSFHRPDDRDYVKFVGQTGQVVSLYTYNPAPGLDTFLTLFNSHGITLTTNDTDPANPAGSRINHAFTETATYYLEVKHVNPAAGGCAFTYYLAATAAQATPTPVPTAPAGEPKLEVFSFYTTPEVVRFYEPFELFVTIRNAGAAPAQDVVVRSERVANQQSGFMADDNSTRSLGRLEIGQQATTSRRYRYIPATADESSDSGAPRPLTISLEQSGRPTASLDLYMRVFKGLNRISDPTVAFTRTLTKPDIIVRKNWTGPAHKLDEERPVNPSEPFELVVELHNIGQVEAHNIYIDFLAEHSNDFFPVGSTAQKYVPGSLRPDGHAFASQTLRFKDAKQDAGSTRWFTLAIFYDFLYAGQRVQERITPRIAISIVRPTPTPTSTPDKRTGSGQGDRGGYAPPDTGLAMRSPVPEAGPSASAAASPAAPQVIVPSYTTDPALPRPGEPFVLTLIVLNAGEAAVRNLLLTWQAGDLLAPANPGAASQLLAYLGPQQAQPVALRLITNDHAAAGPRTYPVRLEYDSSQGGRTSSLQNLDIALAAAGRGRSPTEMATADRTEILVVVDNYTTEPTLVAAGQPFVLNLVLRNLGLTDARQVTIEWQGDALAPLSSGQTQYLAALPAGQTATLTGRFYMQNRGKDGIERVPVQIEFEDAAGRAFQRQEQISLLIASSARQETGEVRAVQPTPTSQPAAMPTAAPAALPKTQPDGQPFLLRLLLALLGLGGQP
ncbi:MAG: hypothetical protein FJ011_10650 [Chloroflexi bacterium]|nr:hypothetical protein [Chloroflexota bacterium]